MTSPRPIDYRTWSREQVDQKFYEDIMTQCRRFLKGPAKAAYLKQCRTDAYRYVGLVRQFGKGAFDANSTVPGRPDRGARGHRPPGGGRSNA